MGKVVDNTAGMDNLTASWSHIGYFSEVQESRDNFSVFQKPKTCSKLKGEQTVALEPCAASLPGTCGLCLVAYQPQFVTSEQDLNDGQYRLHL